ncbi:hypothetical protein Tco_0237827 [Tanacetum coccineum]
MILAAQSEAFKQENVLAERLRSLYRQMEKKRRQSLYLWIEFGFLLVGSVRERPIHQVTGSSGSRMEFCDDNSDCDGDFYLVVLADAAESVRDAIGFEYCLASSSRWTNIQCAPFEALYGRKCRSPVLWAEIGESSLTGLELVQETTDKVVLVKEKPKAARDHQKSYVDYRRPFEILERIGLIAYSLRSPKELNSVHDTFYVLNLKKKKYLADANLHMPLNEIKVDKTLRFVKEPVEIMDRDINKLKRRKIALVKVRWNSKRGGLLAGIHGLFNRRYCGLVRRVTCGYPWPELEGKGFGMIQERFRCFQPLHRMRDVEENLDEKNNEIDYKKLMIRQHGSPFDKVAYARVRAICGYAVLHLEGGMDALSEDELREVYRERGVLGLRSVEDMHQQVSNFT